MRLFLPILLLLNSSWLCGQSNPAITSWIINTTGQTGFAGIPTNVQQVQYSSNNVYISTNNIADWIPAGYDWPNNPWFPESQNFVFKITLNPTEKLSNKIPTPYGHIGIWTNGVSIYNPKDAKSWDDEETWFQNAFYFEHQHIETFDDCLGHPNNLHEYHLHVNPTCLYNDKDSTQHAPLIGFAFDGFPIYGAYGYENPDGTGPIKRLRSSYRLRDITARSSLPDGTALPASLHGPVIAIYPLGAYMEDFEYINGWGDLDQYNGRFCVTPEYPDGIYAYFVTLDEDLEPAFPYVLGSHFFGQVQPGNTGPNSGHNVINEPVNVFTSTNSADDQLLFTAYPNPASDQVNFFLTPAYNSNMTATLFNQVGIRVGQIENVQTAVNYSFDLSNLPGGIYFLRINNGAAQSTTKILVQR